MKTLGYFAPSTLVLLAYLLFVRMATAQSPWTEQGPGPILPDTAYGQASGAINAVAVDPSNPARIFVATVNGGVWRTTNALAASPSWMPLTDHLPTLAISSIAFSPLDPSGNTVFAGFGDFSAGTDTANQRGFAKTVDGGVNWIIYTNAIPEDSQTPGWPQRITKLWPTSLVDPGTGQQVVLAGIRFYRGGVYRSTDGGTNFTRTLAGDDGATDIAPEPGNPSRFYASIYGSSGETGIYLSVDGGLTWTKLNGIAGGLSHRLSVSATADSITGQRPVYVLGDDGTYRSPDSGATWQKLGSFVLVRRIYQSSLAADPNDANGVFAGGVPGVHYWNGSTWQNLEGAAANGTDTHNDSRQIIFDSIGNLLECDDGGIYRLSNPSGNGTRTWVPLIGNLRCTEMFTIAYDSLNHVFFSGTQDNGVIKQSSANSYEAQQELGGDGNRTAADSTSEAGHSQHYITYNGDNLIHRHRYGNANNLLNTGTLPLLVNGSGGKTVYQVDANAGTPSYILNAVSPTNMLLATGGGYLFESASLRAGDTVNNLGQIGAINGWAYGGFSGGIGNRGVIYFGTSSTLWLRTSIGGLYLVVSTYPGSGIRSIAIDPTDWHRPYILDDAGRVWWTTDATDTAGTWTELTGIGAGRLNGLSTSLTKIVVVSHPAVAGKLALAVGGRGGVFVTRNPNDGTAAVWERYGDNFPNLIVTDLLYNSTDDVLLAATYGRGAWKTPNAISTILGLPCPANSPVLNVPSQYATVRIAHTVAGDCNTIRITTGTYAETPLPLILNKHVRLESQGGPATIGR